jgi:hypothetical protein
MLNLATSILFTLLLIQICIFCIITVSLSTHYLGPFWRKGSDQQFHTIVQKFRSSSKICEQQMPSQDHYKKEYGEKVGLYLWKYVQRHREVE